MMICKPTKKQIKFLDWEFGAFFHFGIRSFNPGHVDWDGNDMPIETFNPDSLDCEQWIRAIKSAGAKYAILTAKHHDGFGNWPTKYSSYSVANSPWKNGQGDVVREFTDACRKYNIAIGLYYSPAQWGTGAVSFEHQSEYDDYFINQITELLRNYGKIDYLWFDSCGSDGHTYDKERIISVIRKLQPDILLFGMWDPDTIWTGNEDGYCTLPNLNTRTVDVFDKPTLGFFPMECDCRIRATWFYDLNEDTLKSVEELIGMYESSVGHGSNFLLNIGPDNHGLLNDEDVKRLSELGNEIRKRYNNPLDFDDVKNDGDGFFSISYSQENQEKIADPLNIPHIRSIVIEEDITDGDRIKQFRLYACSSSVNPICDTRYCIYTGETIGHKFICRIPAIRTAKIILEIVDSESEYAIKSIKAYS